LNATRSPLYASILVAQILGAVPGLPAWSFLAEYSATPIARTTFELEEQESLVFAPDSHQKVIIRLQIAGNAQLVPVEAELADTAAKRERGLMFRKYLPENSAMLFVFDPPAQATFWMKDTRIPLSIAFVDSRGRILEIRSMKPFDKTYISSISSTVAYALEVNSGWFGRHGIRLGARIYGMPPVSGTSQRHVSGIPIERARPIVGDRAPGEPDLEAASSNRRCSQRDRGQDTSEYPCTNLLE
jgi:uncharacterized protein